MPNRFGCSCRLERSQRQLISASCNLGILLSKRSSFQCYPILSAATFESTVFGLSRLHGNRLDPLPCPPPSDLSVATGKGRGSTWLSCQIVTELRNFLWARIAQNFCWSLTRGEFDTRAHLRLPLLSGSGSRRALPPNPSAPTLAVKGRESQIKLSLAPFLSQFRQSQLSLDAF